VVLVGATRALAPAIAGTKINHRIPLAEFGSPNFLGSLKAQILGHYPGAKVKPGSIASMI